MSQDIHNISLHLGRGNGDFRGPAPGAASSSPEQERIVPVSAEERRRQDLIRLFWSQGSGPTDRLESLWGDIEMDATTGLSLRSRSKAELQEAILNSLASDVMEARRGAINPAHEKTFHWVFERPRHKDNATTPDKPPWTNFVSWLEKDDLDQIYWITGKPGSGKSTLMKYIVESGHFEDHLQQWAGGSSVKIAVFYSWNAGTDEQRTETGLLKSILYQYMQEMPELLPAVCPRRWAIHRLFGTPLTFSLPKWTTTELRQAFDVLWPLARQNNYKLGLFIDGLDEFQVEDKFRFLLSFAETARAKGAKVCTSSREWTVFADHFRANPSLRLQDLTRGDIERYIRGHLDESVAYAELMESDAAGLEKLVASVLDKASGVFLWVRMVTEVVLDGIEAGETVKELNERVDELPPDLCDLYQGIWDKLGPKDRTNVARMLRLMETSVTLLDAPTMFAAEQPDAEEALNMPLDALEKLVVRRLRSQTRGLLELSELGFVNYLHRTARDWSLTLANEMQKMLPPDFDPSLQLFLAEVAILMILYKPGSWKRNGHQFWPRINVALRYPASVAIQSNDSANAEKLFSALDRLDKWATDTWAGFGHVWHAGNPGRSDDFKPDMHWSSYQNVGGMNPAGLGCSNTFLGVACQYAVVPYVKHKLGACPKLVTPKRNEVGLLENALLIPELARYRSATGSNPWKGLGQSFSQRKTLIRLLLNHGADPRAVPLLLLDASREVFTISHRLELGLDKGGPLYKTIQALSVKTEIVFWKKVQEVFEESMKNRRTFSRFRAKLVGST